MERYVKEIDVLENLALRTWSAPTVLCAKTDSVCATAPQTQSAKKGLCATMGGVKKTSFANFIASVVLLVLFACKGNALGLVSTARCALPGRNAEMAIATELACRVRLVVLLAGECASNRIAMLLQVTDRFARMVSKLQSVGGTLIVPLVLDVLAANA